MSRWLTILAIVLSSALLVGATLSLTGPTVLAQESREGVLLPRVEAPKVERVTEDEQPVEQVKRETFRREEEFNIRVPYALEPDSFIAVTPGLVIERQQLEPIYLERSDEVRPISMALILDNSWSMIRVNPRNGEPPQDPKYMRLDAARNLMGKLREKDQVTLGVFPPRRSVVPVDYPPVDPPLEQVAYRSKPSEVSKALELLRGEENGTTPLYRGIQRGIEVANGVAGNRPIVVALTDGKDTEEIPGTFSSVIETIKAHPETKLYIIALGEGADVPLLQQLTKNIIKVDDSANLRLAFDQIQRDLSKDLIGTHVRLRFRRVDKDFADGESLRVRYKVGAKVKDYDVVLGTPVTPLTGGTKPEMPKVAK
ncbi:MAG: VWA domain-containing protein [Chthonomonas sp.]|nr:VWA domain-containing protein [Chthonomonas sp.]